MNAGSGINAGTEKAARNVEARRQIMLAVLADGSLRTADQLAQASSVSVRTVYRAVSRLRAAGADIRGQAGIGYMLRRPLL